MHIWKRAALSGLFMFASFYFVSLPAHALDPNYEKGVSSFKAKNFTEAAKYFELTMRRNPADSNALYYDAQCYEQLGENARAKALYQHCINIFPNSFVAAYAQRILNSRKWEVAPMAGNPDAQAPPADTPPADPIADLLSKAKELNEAGKQALAERCLQDALNESEKLGSSNPKLADSLQALGDLYTEKGDGVRAGNYYRRELQMRERLSGKNSTAVAQRMMSTVALFQKSGDFSTAEDYARRSVDIYQRQYDAAERTGKRMVQESQNLTGAMSKLAEILRIEKRNQEALNIENEMRQYQQ
jgi:tetratricopeptide (TPR) repeat protein